MQSRSKRQRAGWAGLLGLAVAGAIGATEAQGAVLLELDLNSVEIQARSGLDGTGDDVPFLPSHTGSLVFSRGSLGYMSSVRMDGVKQDGTGGADLFDGVLQAVSGYVNLSGGQVTGGQVTVTVSGPGGTDTYTAQLGANPQNVLSVAGSNYALAAPALAGDLSDASFAGVNVAAFLAAEPLSGDLKLPLFQPNASGFARGPLELSAVVPEPGALGLAGALGAGLLMRRRGRRAGN